MQGVRLATSRPLASTRAAALRSVLVTGAMLGVGIAGFVDEALFHQLLQWHSFYWSTDEHGRVFSDGLFHVGSTLLLLWGAARLWRASATSSPVRSRGIIAGLLIGAGAFNTYDGLVQHLILHLHLVNEHVCPRPMDDNSVMTCPRDLPYEIVWIAVGAAVTGIGLVAWRRVVKASSHTDGRDLQLHAAKQLNVSEGEDHG